MPDENDKFCPLVAVSFILLCPHSGSDFYFWAKSSKHIPSGKYPNCQKKQNSFAVCLEPVGFGAVLDVFFFLGSSILTIIAEVSAFVWAVYFLIKANPIAQKSK